jgi:hypothetical protein
MSNRITVWDGVKIGCGIFIVLPAIILGLFFLLVAIPACSKIKEQRAEQVRMKGGSHD